MIISWWLYEIFVQHPYKERIELNIGAITQIVGQNKELKYYIWQILSWYFGGKNTQVMT